MGYYGEIAGEVAPAVLDRVSSRAGLAEPIRERPGALVPPRVEKLKAERGPFKSAGDLLLAAYFSSSQLAPLVGRRAAGAAEHLKPIVNEGRPSTGFKSADSVFERAV
jgi:hypothetical protein